MKPSEVNEALTPPTKDIPGNEKRSGKLEEEASKKFTQEEKDMQPKKQTTQAADEKQPDQTNQKRAPKADYKNPASNIIPPTDEKASQQQELKQ